MSGLNGDHKCGIIITAIISAVFCWGIYAWWNWAKYEEALQTPALAERLLGLEEEK